MATESRSPGAPYQSALRSPSGPAGHDPVPARTPGESPGPPTVAPPQVIAASENWVRLVNEAAPGPLSVPPGTLHRTPPGGGGEALQRLALACAEEELLLKVRNVPELAIACRGDPRQTAAMIEHIRALAVEAEAIARAYGVDTSHYHYALPTYAQLIRAETDLQVVLAQLAPSLNEEDPWWLKLLGKFLAALGVTDAAELIGALIEICSADLEAVAGHLAAGRVTEAVRLLIDVIKNIITSPQTGSRIAQKYAAPIVSAMRRLSSRLASFAVPVLGWLLFAGYIIVALAGQIDWTSRSGGSPVPRARVRGVDFSPLGFPRHP